MRAGNLERFFKMKNYSIKNVLFSGVLRSALVLLLLTVCSPRSVYSLIEEEINNIEVYQKSKDGVVNISSVVIQYDFFLNPVPGEGVGSGSIIDAEGYILTNNHVIRNARQLDVTLADGKKFKARLVGSEPSLDLAMIKIEPRGELLKPLRFGNSENLRVGDKVLAIGNPFGLEQTLTTGIISFIGRDLRVDRDLVIENMIQTDASINPGNSGGPLLDSKGKIIGVNTAILSPTGTSVGVGFAIPADQVKKVLSELRGETWHIWHIFILLGILTIFIIWRIISRAGSRK